MCLTHGRASYVFRPRHLGLDSVLNSNITVIVIVVIASY